jgi:S-adenosylmethionine hydrolase
MLLPFLALAAVGLATPRAGADDDGARRFSATIIGVGTTFGNLHTDLPVSNLGIANGQGFLVTCGEQTFDATLADWYNDVEAGAWVGLTNPDGRLQIAINNGDADQTSGCGQGDVLTITVNAAR